MVSIFVNHQPSDEGKEGKQYLSRKGEDWSFSDRNTTTTQNKKDSMHKATLTVIISDNGDYDDYVGL